MVGMNSGPSFAVMDQLAWQKMSQSLVESSSFNGKGLCKELQETFLHLEQYPPQPYGCILHQSSSVKGHTDFRHRNFLFTLSVPCLLSWGSKRGSLSNCLPVQLLPVHLLPVL